MKPGRGLIVCAVLISLSACVGPAGQIGTNLTLCCPGDYDSYLRYSLSTEQIPAFLRDYLVSEFDAALQEKGLRRNDAAAQISVLLRYNHVNLRSEQEDIDPFARIESMNLELSYLATVEVVIAETNTGTPVFGGSISRVHRVAPGEYMHEDAARPAFRQAFRNLLASYPELAGTE